MEDKQEPNSEQDGRKSAAAGADSESQARTGDPGRTPGKAEGDEETVDEALRQKENG